MNDSANQPPEGDKGPRPRSERSRRRARKPLILDNTVPSPCLAICRFDGGPFCVGCFRDVDEIREWMIMSREQKLAVLEKLAERRQDAAKSRDSS